MENNLNLTPEMLEQASKAPSATELLTLAQENGIALTAEQAAVYYTKLHPETGALSDEELDNVSGGGACHDDTGPKPKRCVYCMHTEFKYESRGLLPGKCWYCQNCFSIGQANQPF